MYHCVNEIKPYLGNVNVTLNNAKMITKKSKIKTPSVKIKI